MFMRLFSLARRACPVYFETMAVDFEPSQLRCDRFDFIEDRVVEVDDFPTRITNDVVVTRRHEIKPARCVSVIHLLDETDFFKDAQVVIDGSDTHVRKSRRKCLINVIRCRVTVLRDEVLQNGLALRRHSDSMFSERLNSMVKHFASHVNPSFLL